MRNKAVLATKAALIGLLLIGLSGWGRGQPARSGQAGVTQVKEGTAAAQDAGREADREAIRTAAREFAEAFNKGDAKAAASHWTEQGEYQDDTGDVIRGRAAIEKAFADHFKEKTGGRIEVQISSIRFSSRDCAMEEGTLRQTNDGPALPTSTRYSSVLVREDGRWKIGWSREWDMGQDRLEDLHWLLGVWKGKSTDQEAQLSFEKDGNRPFLIGQFSIRADNKVIASGNLKIGLDAQRGQFRSWHFDDDGGHGQAIWLRDGNHWLLDASGVLADGTEISAVNVLARLTKDEFTWRSTERFAGEQALPDTLPIRLTRVSERK